MDAQRLPLDILPPILEHLTDRRDWLACSLVSWSFNRAATPILYHTLDSRIISKSLLHHPSTTLLRRPELARYVRSVTETGAVHRALQTRYPNITEDTLAALSLCKNLNAITWIDDSSTTNSVLFAFIETMRNLPLKEMTIRTYSDLGQDTWSQLITLSGLRKLSVWSMTGPLRVLQGWTCALGPTLMSLELGVSTNFSYPFVELLSQLPLLKDLRLKGAPASWIPTILSHLPDLECLETDYLFSASSPMIRRHQSLPIGITEPPNSTMPRLRHLTVRTSSIDMTRPQRLWSWIHDIARNGPSLETFKLYAFTLNMASTNIPRMFILDLAMVHKDSLRRFLVGEVNLTLMDLECLCAKFPNLESIGCSVASPDTDSIAHALRNGQNLTSIELEVQWLPEERILGQSCRPRFSAEIARNLMEQSRLRSISISSVLYTGQWILRDGQPYLDVKTTMTHDKYKWRI
ncbi:hypothetical protein C8J56DRAFT_1160593 [Mycena floridula]|nr:hypothetical protein C8J56DRAFT_1160593 [Mycena floridula]